MARSIMVQGTASSVGKSIIAAALCRIFVQDGYRVAPFKSQNMALNSFVTKEGGEMGRAQVVQAEACGIDPSVLMNPILLKPTSDKKAQVVINGRVFRNMDAQEYHEYKLKAREVVVKAYEELARLWDIIVIEGAGSPAEINLRDKDIVNMGMAEIADSPVVLVADIDRGGVFASIVGTIFLLTEEEKKRVKGVIINKFRGDVEILKPGIKMLEDIIKIPVLGVVPHFKLNLEDEDSVTERFSIKNSKGDIKIDVVRLPHISNFSDFDSLAMCEDVSLNYVERPEEIKRPDMIILPGSKNTIEDLQFVRRSGLGEKILELHKQGTMLVGICGGYQMLGERIEDPDSIEGDTGTIDGLGIFGMKTVIAKNKITKQVKGRISANSGMFDGLRGSMISGYEIHMGISSGSGDELAVAETDNGEQGMFGNNAFGIYMHGIFDNMEFTRGLLNNIRKKRGLAPVVAEGTYAENKESEFDRLAGIVRENIDMNKIYSILNADNVSCC